MTTPTIGFIGLGLMGRAMVECLQGAGYAVTVLGNRDRTGVEEAISRGGTEAESAKALAESADIVMLCVGTSDQVESRVYGDNGVLAGAKQGQVVIDFGTSLPESTKKIGAALAEKGATYLDAPLGRTPAHAKDGQLNIMCAGDADAYARVKPVLDVLGENVFHLGALGNGHTIKLINNYFAMTTACAMAEAFAVADTSGIERQALYDVMAAGPNHSGMMGFIRNYAVDGQVDLAFSVANAAKDVGYYRQMAQDLGLQSRMSGAADATLREARDGGEGNMMVPAMVDWMQAHLGEKK
ncbi:2-hydroxy-3-oxopropionate reductase [Rhodobacteraceae bacterium THAF1]|uniref:NAD(P)-dependent oxidoreductase n=1 Tax=Palleronia sp. THAF1 TaxID=2587842 RepID=UPI000F3F5DFB|nr:NAD(P)-dependent oxidoreductase [Palleronia sp. THAF1]QFU09674.1 2-hydroxy-3-oxopropionate reductase [Palleronia sp. THAF1]VDC17423.1 2-hydroxy-3-oxopropionate reductase [Rhodobacteraceae bacterium THAF1]